MKQKKVDIIFDVFNYGILFIIVILGFYPFYYIIVYSLTNPDSIVAGSLMLYPAKFSLYNYETIFQQNDIYMAFFISASRAVAGTILTILCCSFFAYLVTQKKMYLRKFVYRFLILTMYFNAGLIPWYVTMINLHLKNNFLLYILPSAISGFYVILLKTYIETVVPPMIEESAMVDGAGVLTIFRKIILPMCAPILATVAVFSAVGQWNSWQDNFFLASVKSLTTLQLVLLRYLTSIDAQRLATEMNARTVQYLIPQVTEMSIKTAISVVSILPMMLVYPFAQKYFVRGIVLGAVKG